MQPTLCQRSLRAARLAAATAAFLLFLLAAGGFAGRLAHLCHSRWILKAAGGYVAAQAGPVMLRAAACGAFAALLVHIAVTLLLGRWFCGTLCPLGLWQDLVWRIARLARGRRRPARENAAAFARRSAAERMVRLALAGLCFGALAAGFAAGFRALEPYSLAWRGAHAALRGAALLGAFVPVAAVTLFALWRGRLFCTAFCPVGTALGLLSKCAPLRIRMTDACVKCGACAAVCPSHCIDVANGAVDNERCVRCLACVTVCKVRGIGYSVPHRQVRNDAAAPEPQHPAFSPSRRAFLKGAATLAAGLAAGAVLAKAGMRRVAAVAKRALGILPPGAGTPERFAARCTGCLRCVGVCEGRILKPSPHGATPVRIDLSEGACAFDCHHCAQACPTGAIRRMPLAEKQRTRIAHVDFHPDHCIVFQTEEWCGRCADACPTGALTLRSNGTPKVAHPERCIGCGACQRACPGWHADDDPPDAFPKAMRVVPLEDGVQTLTAEPAPVSNTPQPTRSQP